MKATRRLRVEALLIEANPRWEDPTITFNDCNGKEAVVHIKTPWHVASVRRELDKITAYWKEKANL